MTRSILVGSAPRVTVDLSAGLLDDVAQIEGRLDDLETDTSAYATAGHSAGRRPRMVGGTLRNYGAAGKPTGAFPAGDPSLTYWQWIDNHGPVGFLDTVRTLGTAIEVDVSFPFLEANSFTVTPDDLLSVQGYQAGASVGNPTVSIRLGRSGGVVDQIYWSPTEDQNAPAGGFVLGSGVAGVNSVEWDGGAGILTINHDPIPANSFGVTLTRRIQNFSNANLTPVVSSAAGAFAETTTKVSFLSEGSVGSTHKTRTQAMNFYFNRFSNGSAGAGMDVESVSGLGNLWLAGMFEVAS